MPRASVKQVPARRLEKINTLILSSVRSLCVQGVCDGKRKSGASICRVLGRTVHRCNVCSGCGGRSFYAGYVYRIEISKELLADAVTDASYCRRVL
jgi:hypothetical protein